MSKDMSMAKAMKTALANPDGKAAAAMNRYFDMVEASIKELRETSLRYRGIWSAAVNDYERGHLATHKGALWHCNKDGTNERPGSGEGWTLMSKNM
jgi:hypothetical protein